MKRRLALAVMLTAAAGTATAMDATQQPRKELRKGGYCVSNNFDGANAVFKCEHLGQVTIREIYEKGWRVVLKRDVPRVSAAMGLIIEEQ